LRWFIAGMHRVHNYKNKEFIKIRAFNSLQ